MDNGTLLTALRKARAAQDEAKRRRARMAEFKRFCSGGTLVFTGLLLATLYGLLTHQIHY